MAGSVNRTLLSLNNSSGASSSVQSTPFLRKVALSRFPNPKVSSNNLKVDAEVVDEEKQSNKDKWKGLAFDTSDDQQDITRGKGMVDTLFQAPTRAGNHNAVMSSYDYISTGLCVMLWRLIIDFCSRYA